MRNQIAIGTTTFAITKIEIVQGYLDQRDVHWLDHKRAKNWVATARFDPSAPNCLARLFWKRGSGSYVAVPPSLALGEVLEFGADYYTCGGHRQGRREYRRVLAITPQEIVVREIGKPGKKPLRPVGLDIQAAEIGGEAQPAPSPLVDASIADLVAELRRRGASFALPPTADSEASHPTPAPDQTKNQD
jgi:hypothetical protein